MITITSLKTVTSLKTGTRLKTVTSLITVSSLKTVGNAVEALKTTYLISSPEAVAFAEQLRLSNILRHVTDEYKPFTESNSLYRLCCHQHADVLNSYGTWPSGRKCSDPVRLSTTLLNQVEKLEKRLAHRGHVNYKYACKTRLFPPFEYAVCELQQVDLKSMNNEARLVSVDSVDPSQNITLG